MARKLVTLLVIASFATLVFAFAGCGGDDESASGDTTTTETTTTEETTDTETTETETTETETTDTTETETTASGGFATSKNCQEFQEFGTKISQAFTGSDTGNLQEVTDQLQTFADEAPDEIKDDFQTLADGFAKIADALEGVDLNSTTPDPQALAKISQLGTEWSTKMTTASTNIATWAQQNCTG